jgi:ABC-type sulfate transport system permease subunit
VTLGLLIPVVAIIVGAFQAPGTGAFTTAAMTPGAAVAVSLPAVPVLVTPRRATGDAPVLAG